MTYLKVRQILEIIDEKFDYSLNKEVQQILNELHNDDVDKHVITRKTWVKYVNEYKEIKRKECGIAEHDLLSIDNIVRKDGLGTSGTKYHVDDVMAIINHEVFHERLNNTYIEKTIDIEERDNDILRAFNVKNDKTYNHQMRIPKVAYEYVQESIEEIENQLLNIVIDEFIDREKIRDDAFDRLLNAAVEDVDPKRYLI